MRGTLLFWRAAEKLRGADTRYPVFLRVTEIIRRADARWLIFGRATETNHRTEQRWLVSLSEEIKKKCHLDAHQLVFGSGQQETFAVLFCFALILEGSRFWPAIHLPPVTAF